MQKIINAHCHIYPEKIASKAVEGIKSFYDLDLELYLDGTVEGLIRDGQDIGVVHYLVHSVATTPEQVHSINTFISNEVKAHEGLFTGFGTLHPDSEDLEGDIEDLISLGLKGIKIHPDFQRFPLNGNRAMKLGSILQGRGLPLLVHCGDPRFEFSNPDQMKPFLEAFPDLTVIGAHFGGWSKFDEAASKLAGIPNLYVDCSSTFYYVSPEKGRELIEKFGADRILWGSDYPMWDAKQDLERFRKLGLTSSDEQLILYENAAKLLKINEYK